MLHATAASGMHRLRGLPTRIVHAMTPVPSLTSPDLSDVAEQRHVPLPPHGRPPQLCVLVALGLFILLPVASVVGQTASTPVTITVGEFIAGFGVESGRIEEELSTITDVAVAGDGTVFLLHALAARIRAVSTSGSYLDGFGRPGAGPGEFRNPSALAYNREDNELYVLDNATARISALKWDGKHLVYSRSIKASPWGVDLCYMGDRIYMYAHAGDGGHNIHVLKPSGEEVASFGEPFGIEGGPDLIAAHIDAFLVCDQSGALVTLSDAEKPDTKAYSSDGRLLWRGGQVKDFQAVAIKLVPGGVLLDRANSPKLTDRFDAAVLILPGLLLLQYERRERFVSVGATVTKQRFSIFIDTRSGRRVGLQQGLPRVVGVHGDTLLTVLEDPFPRLEAHRFSWSPR